MTKINYKPKLLSIFEGKPNSAFEVSDLSELLGVGSESFYNDLQYLVRSKIVSKALPGLNGGRKCTYFKRVR